MLENINELQNNFKITKHLSVYEPVNIIAQANNSAKETDDAFGKNWINTQASVIRNSWSYILDNKTIKW
jgi:hypothetical protein